MMNQHNTQPDVSPSTQQDTTHNDSALTGWEVAGANESQFIERAANDSQLPIPEEFPLLPLAQEIPMNLDDLYKLSRQIQASMNSLLALQQDNLNNLHTSEGLAAYRATTDMLKDLDQKLRMIDDQARELAQKKEEEIHKGLVNALEGSASSNNANKLKKTTAVETPSKSEKITPIVISDLASMSEHGLNSELTRALSSQTPDAAYIQKVREEIDSRKQLTGAPTGPNGTFAWTP
jgi:hypothetical protein